MKKRVFALLFVITVAVILVFGITFAEADTLTDGVYQYTVTDGEATITKCDRGVSGELVIPNTLGGYPVTAIGEFAFWKCYKLTAITIPEGVRSIGKKAFWELYQCEKITLPSTIVTLGQNAFEACSKLTSFTIPANCTSIDKSVFIGCSSLKEIKVDRNNAYFKVVDGCLFANNMTEFVLYPQGREGTAYTVPQGVKVICGGAFYYAALNSISLPDGLLTIGDEAFCYVTNMKKIYIPDSVTSIGVVAFSHCLSLTEVNIPKNITSINIHAFYCCSNLKRVVIPNGVTEILDNAFGGCRSLETVIIPKSVEKITYGAFGGCNALQTVYYRGNQSEWANVSIGDSNDAFKKAEFIYNAVDGGYLDLNGDFNFDSDDAIHLLYAVLFGVENYPLNYGCDLDKNDVVDSDDAIYLLYSILFGEEMYPLK